jgi:hypothetical protein
VSEIGSGLRPPLHCVVDSFRTIPSQRLKASSTVSQAYLQRRAQLTASTTCNTAPQPTRMAGNSIQAMLINPSLDYSVRVGFDWDSKRGRMHGKSATGGADMVTCPCWSIWPATRDQSYQTGTTCQITTTTITTRIPH